MTDGPDLPAQVPDPEEAGGPPTARTPAPGPRRRVRRRASRAGTNPSADDAPDVLPPREGPAPGESEHDRWLREQRPPHWE